MIQSIVARFGGQSATLADLRSALLCCFMGFFRSSELLGLKLRDIAFDATNAILTVSIRKSKCDQFCVGQSVLLGTTGDFTCPIRMLLKYIHMANITEPNAFLF